MSLVKQQASKQDSHVLGSRRQWLQVGAPVTPVYRLCITVGSEGVNLEQRERFCLGTCSPGIFEKKIPAARNENPP